MLNTIKVMDLSRVLAGPLCTMMLGDLGADVLKVERPRTGDDTRGWGPPFDGEGESAYFRSVNRNKASLAADLRDPEDLALVRRLAGEADVVVDNFRPGVLAGLGLDADDLLREHGQLLWCTITGFGPESRRPGYDFVVQAEQGWMAITGEPHGEPMKSGVALADVVAGKDAAVAILAALVARERARASGRTLSLGDRRIHISLARSAGAALVNAAQNSLVSGIDSSRWGNAHANLVPYQLFETADRSLVIAVGTDDQWGALLEVLGTPELDVPELAKNSGRVAHRDRVVAAVAGRLRERSASDWHAELERAGVPSGVVRSVLEVVREAGGSPLTGMPPAVGGIARMPPPRLDEHGAGVRDEGWGWFERLHRRE
jgi:crotonobetainyl-CoA:carnitine CoA-transferase CaiB-like acyl-CoA transferase